MTNFTPFNTAFRLLECITPKTVHGDALFNYLNFCIRHGRRPNRSASFNDELNRIKSSSEALRPERSGTACKHLVKDYVRARASEKFVIPTIARLTTPDEIDNFEFPQRCVIKGAHTSGDVIIRRNGEVLPIDTIKSWLMRNYYRERREAFYRYLTPSVIVEPIIFDGRPVNDYKIFCVNAEPKMIQVDVDRHIDHRRNLYDVCWSLLDFGIAYPKFPGDVPRPTNLEAMLELSRVLAEPFGFVRIDLYTNDTEIFVGEITHCHGSAWEKFIPASGELQANKLLFG